MSTAIPPVPAEAAPAPGLSEPQRILNAYFAPAKTFEDIRRNQSWWIPWLLISIAAAAFFFTVEKKVGFDTIVRQQIAHGPEFAQRAMEQLPPEQREKAINQRIAGSRIIYLYFSWAITLISGLILAALLMGAFNFILEADIPFKNALSVTFHALLVRVLAALIGILVLFKGVDPEGFDIQNPIATNLGVLLDPNTSNKFLYHLLSGIDIFTIWLIILLGMGFAIQSRKKKKMSTGTGITTVAVIYGIFLLVRAALPF
jgi:Yip1-like protein